MKSNNDQTTTTSEAESSKPSRAPAMGWRAMFMIAAMLSVPVLTTWLARASSGDSDPDDARPRRDPAAVTARQAVAAQSGPDSRGDGRSSEARGSETRAPEARGPGGGGMGRFGRGVGPMFPPPSQQEVQDVVAFFRDHAPNRFALYEQLDDGTFARRRVLRVMINRYRQVQRYKDSDPDLHALAVKQFELQDEAFGILRNAVTSSSGGADADTLARLRDKVRELARLSMAERERRVERLEKMLSEERSRLDADKADPDALVDRQLKQIRTEADEVKRHFDQLQDFQRTRDARTAPTSQPTTAPAEETR